MEKWTEDIRVKFVAYLYVTDESLKALAAVELASSIPRLIAEIEGLRKENETLRNTQAGIYDDEIEEEAK